ncbi:MAG: hypothetical protein Q7T62_00595 [Undibacterium sp.]|nr:hypothetical protein [Undibacterium sp.]
MRKLDRRNEMAELNDDATEGQMADYFAAEASGDNDAWNLGIVQYECRRCKYILETQSDELMSYDRLIHGWHDKAKDQDDPFSSFVFEYLSFIAHLKHNLYFKATSDREAIQNLKQDGRLAEAYLDRIRSEHGLREAWESLIRELASRPLHNSSYDLENPEIDKWWNCTESRYEDYQDRAKGAVHDLADWSNMVEFWYAVRNNLFHGGKDPDVKRDEFLVSNAFLTIRRLMDIEFQT